MNAITEAIQASNLDTQKAEILTGKFSYIERKVENWKRCNEKLIITDSSEVAYILMAKDAYKQVKNVRIDIERNRKVLKEDSLKEGRAIDMIAKILTEQLIPLEKSLEAKAKFVEIQEAERKLAKIYARMEQATHLGFAIAQTSMISDMSDEMFGIYLSGLQADAEKREAFRIEAEAKAEAERVEKLRLETEAKEAQIIENYRLKAEAQIREEAFAAERQAREKVEAEMETKAEMERLETLRIEAEARKQANAPDIEKLENYIINLRSVSIPELNNDNANKILAALTGSLKSLLEFHLKAIYVL